MSQRSGRRPCSRGTSCSPAATARRSCSGPSPGRAFERSTVRRQARALDEKH